MSSRDLKSGILYSNILLKEEFNYSKRLDFDYCGNCNTETYKYYDFCLNCNSKYLNDVVPNELVELKILNNYKNYSEKERYSIDLSLRIIGRYYYTFLFKNLTKDVIDLLNDQREFTYLGAIIDLLILIYKDFKNKNTITIEEIRNLKTILFELEDKKEINLRSGILINMFIRKNILKKDNKGTYSFNRKDIFIK